jgi:integration host factor subunit beta
MIKSELILRVAAPNPHLYNRDVENVVNTIFDEIEAALVRRERVELRGFGIFTLKTRSARPGRNPKTGALINVPETQHPSFRTGKEMHARLNGILGSAPSAAFHTPTEGVKPAEPKA